MTVPASSTYNGWWDDRENGQYDLYYRGTLIGSMTATGLLMVIPTAAIGYGAGAGGSVTQASSKTTAVTINTLCGSITGDNASLSGAAEATYIVSNSNVAIGDVVVASIRSGGTPGEYTSHVTTVADGSFRITLGNVANVSADAVIVNFAVIKAVNS